MRLILIFISYDTVLVNDGRLGWNEIIKCDSISKIIKLT